MPEGAQIFFFAGMAVCAVMIPVNLALVKRRGVSSVALAAAFAAMGALFWAMATDQPRSVIAALATLVVVLLLADMLLRVRHGRQGTAK